MPPCSIRYGLPLMILGFTVGLAAYTVHRDRASAEALVRGEALVHMMQRMSDLQQQINDALAAGRRERAMEQVQFLGGEGQTALLADEDAVVQAASIHQWVGQTLRAMDETPLEPWSGETLAGLIERVKSQPGGEVRIASGGRYVVGAYPVSFGSGRSGVFLVRTDLTRPLARAHRAIGERTADMVALLAALAVALGIGAHVMVTRRLQRLVFVTQRFAGGELKARARLTGRDEVASLGGAFDRMADEVEQVHQRLEAEVLARTEELARTVRELETEVRVRREAELALFDEKERIQITLASIGDAVITTDGDGFIEYVNRSAELLAGRPASQVTGRRLGEVFNFVDEASGAPLPDPVRQCLLGWQLVEIGGGAFCLEDAGRRRYIDLSAAPIRNHGGIVSGAVLVCRDVTEMRQATRSLNYQATHDPLTGLINRREFERRLQRVLATASSEDAHTVLYLDLDQFKVVNDTCGHAAGDELLRQIAQVLLPEVRKRDTVARLGGDEFGVLLEHCLPDQSLKIANQLRATMQDFRFVWEDRGFSVGVSIGMVPVAPGIDSLASVLRAADSACYAAKDQGRNRVHVYQAGDEDLARRHGEMQWVPRIQEALTESRFALFFQPIVALGRAHFTHCEVLLRLVERDGSLVSPARFVPAAERYNQMQSIDRWVVRHVFEALCDPAVMPDSVSVAINLSGQSLSDPQFLLFVEEQVERRGVPLDRVCFEITETAAISNLSYARRFFAALKPRGCRFALDDFGSGLSSFRYLKDLPVDFLKIDGSFVRDMVLDPIDHAMVEAIHHIGHVMGIQTIAEFAENKAILARLKQIGVDYAQGYAVAKPQPLELLAVAPGSPGA